MHTHAEFRARREAIGLSQRDVAEAMGVQERSARRWEAPGNYLAPDDAWEWLERMEATYAKGVAAALAQVADIAEDAGGLPETVALTYYRSQREYDELGRDEGPYGFRNAMTREVGRKLRERGIKAVIAFTDEDAVTHDE